MVSEKKKIFSSNATPLVDAILLFYLTFVKHVLSKVFTLIIFFLKHFDAWVHNYKMLLDTEYVRTYNLLSKCYLLVYNDFYVYIIYCSSSYHSIFLLSIDTTNTSIMTLPNDHAHFLNESKLMNHTIKCKKTKQSTLFPKQSVAPLS